MGTQPANIERQVEEQRERIGEKVAGLRVRLREDAREARSMMRRQAYRASRWTLRGLVLVIAAFVGGLSLGAMYMRRRDRRREQWVVEVRER